MRGKKNYYKLKRILYRRGDCDSAEPRKKIVGLAV